MASTDKDLETYRNSNLKKEDVKRRSCQKCDKDFQPRNKYTCRCDSCKALAGTDISWHGYTG